MLPMGRGDGVNGVWGVRVPMVPPPPLIQYQENALRQSRTFYADWEGIADAAVGNPRAEAGRDPYDRDLTELVGELSIRSEDFRVRWASHDVRQYRTGSQPFHQVLVGDLTLSYEALQLTADIGLTLGSSSV